MQAKLSLLVALALVLAVCPRGGADDTPKPGTPVSPYRSIPPAAAQRASPQPPAALVSPYGYNPHVPQNGTVTNQSRPSTPAYAPGPPVCPPRTVHGGVVPNPPVLALCPGGTCCPSGNCRSDSSDTNLAGILAALTGGEDCEESRFIGAFIELAAENARLKVQAEALEALAEAAQEKAKLEAKIEALEAVTSLMQENAKLQAALEAYEVQQESMQVLMRTMMEKAQLEGQLQALQALHEGHVARAHQPAASNPYENAIQHQRECIEKLQAENQKLKAEFAKLKAASQNSTAERRPSPYQPLPEQPSESPKKY